ncbi:hypothetical protein JCM4814A_73940 [Streptomyces phaeofaciens JCM 4814]|uniref:Uncharacterized protein n=1 Tax=Streptomyces phaeofaciens TaxID=68254 RepID=A0A918LXB0_9ACTN|nr:hypothetical protein [Streptomyces phaeofaciens]GGT63461.1 hypothetical protein GCM10010226_46400 [Streptomyces phaeofaciens]
MKVLENVRRGVRLGTIVGAWPAGVLGGLCLLGALVFLVGGHEGTARKLGAAGVVAALGSMALGVALGAATGAVLAAAPRAVLKRPPLRGLLAALTTGVPLTVLGVAALTEGEYTLASYPPSSHAVMWSVPLVVALVMAAHSGDIAGVAPGTPRETAPPTP